MTEIQSAPEFVGTELEVPSQIIDQEYFCQWTAEMNMNTQLQDILLAHRVIDWDLLNRYGCRIPLITNWKLDNFTHLLNNYDDLEVIEWLKFGFPIARDLTDQDPTPASENHAEAINHPECIDKYIEKEMGEGALLGPFMIPPFIRRIGISPLSTRPKRDSDKRRVIMDLSFPAGSAVNDGISKHVYCGEEVNLTYPTIDRLAKQISEIGKSAKIWKKDMIRSLNRFCSALASTC